MGPRMATDHRFSDWFLESRLKIRHLRLFAALDTHRAMGRAAEALHLTQPAASRMLGEVERTLGLKLFERLPRGVTPTAYGEVMVRRARSILAELDRAGEEVLALHQGHWVASIGSTSAPGVGLIIAAIRAARARRPDLHITVHTETSEGLIGKVLDGTLDLAICRLPPAVAALPLLHREIGGEQLCVVCGAGWKGAPGTALDLAALAQGEWVLHPPGSVVRQAAEDAFRLAGLAMPRRVVDTTSFAVTLALLQQGATLSMVPHSVGRLYASLGTIRVLPITMPVEIPPVGLIRPRDRILPPGAMLLLETLTEAIEARPPALT